VNGRDIVLTIDADLQKISEDLLAKSVIESNASGGIVLIADPWTGELLAVADTPVIHDRSREGGDPRVWTNFNFTGHYEPGSIFKIFTTSFLLKRAVVDTGTVFDCDDIRFDGYRIRNSEGHDFGHMSLMDAFAQSSNVYFARAALNLTREEFHRDLVEFGFGAPANIRYPGKALGLLKPPREWSKRTLSTMAIGQELAVTPVQLVMAACAVANGGKLMTPQLVREIRLKDRRVIQDFKPVVQREILNKRQAQLVRAAMTRVVQEGTGRSADTGWISSAGKTGTAQKAIPGQGYVTGLYMSSYLGMVPAENPRLVILTMLDEPDYTHHYAAQSAAPLFGDITTEIGRSTDWLQGAEITADSGTKRNRRGKGIPVPDLMYLQPDIAAKLLHKAGLQASIQGQGGLVIAQDPICGMSLSKGDSVRIVLAQTDAQGAVGDPCPSLIGLSLRQLRRTCALMGIKLETDGIGYVKHQTPQPGVALTAEGIRVIMEM
jgi:stage V sporulation protein D (sporulation-specific penicillin-binding protein)